MLNNIEKGFATRSASSTFIVFTLLIMFLSDLSFAGNNAQASIQHTMDFQTAKNLISDIRGSKLDYLKNEKQLKQAFEVSRSENWEVFHLESAALYGELLFRQEKYDELNNHINIYLENDSLRKQWDLYLLLLESKLKYLSHQEDPTPAQSLAKQLEAWLPERPPKEKIIILRAIAYYYIGTDALKKPLMPH